MDTRTGKCFEGHDLTDIAKQALGGNPTPEQIEKKKKDLVTIDRMPDPDCKKCKGRGSRKAGLRSKRFKPCICTYSRAELKSYYEKKHQRKE